MTLSHWRFGITLVLLSFAAILPATVGAQPPAYLTQWGSDGTGAGQFHYPSGVATDAAGDVYVADAGNNRIQKFTGTGIFITQWGSFGSGNGELSNPWGVATDAAGYVYVADFYNHRIQKFTGTGIYITQWGSQGGGNGQFSFPNGVATDSAGHVYVTEYGNSRIQKFTSTGTYLDQWGGPGSGSGQFSTPYGVATNGAGDVYVADSGNNRIQKFSGNSTYLTQWGSFGSGNGQFNGPSAVASNAAGDVYVADLGSNRIQKFTGTGTYLTQWGSSGSGDGQFSDPWGVATDAIGAVYVVDHSNHRIQKFGSAVAPLANDNFSNATGIDLNALPFSETVTITGATTEPGEPQACSYSVQTVWYKLTSATGRWLRANTLGSSLFGANLNVYRDTGSGIFGLNFIGCSSYDGSVPFFAQTGATYYLQAQAPCCGASGSIRVNVEQTPPPVPVAAFYFYPSDPSIFDTIQFYDNSYDPGQQGIQSRAWNFGDGSTATGPSPTHHYAADGDYAVQLTVTTVDGRTADTSQVVAVRTHDVAITKFTTPQSAGAGQTRQISVGIRNSRYPESVRVQLEKSDPGSYGGFQPVGSLDQLVPVRPSNRTTDFNFSYTFTGDDARIGKVTFRAVATLLVGHDALLADNMAVSSPVKIKAVAAVSDPQAGSHLTAGSVTQVRWQTSGGGPVASVALLFSDDGGSTWSPIADGQPNTGSYDWTVPNVQTDQAKVAVVLLESAGETVDLVDGAFGVSDLFSINAPVGVGDRGPAQLALRGVTPNPARLELRVSFSLRDSKPATLALFDVSGRQLAARQVDGMGPGWHTVALGGRNNLPGGLYIIRLTQDGQSLTTRAAFVR